MSILDAHETIRTRFVTIIEDPGSLSVQHDNMEYAKPENQLWCRFTILTGGKNRRSIGSAVSRYRNFGIATAQLFSPIGLGEKVQMTLADLINDTFISVAVDGVIFQTPKIIKMGRIGSEWQINVDCPFYFDTLE